MPYYLAQAAYTPESWVAQIKAQPDPRVRVNVWLKLSALAWTASSTASTNTTSWASVSSPAMTQRPRSRLQRLAGVPVPFRADALEANGPG